MNKNYEKTTFVHQKVLKLHRTLMHRDTHTVNKSIHLNDITLINFYFTFKLITNLNIITHIARIQIVIGTSMHELRALRMYSQSNFRNETNIIIFRAADKITHFVKHVNLMKWYAASCICFVLTTFKYCILYTLCVSLCICIHTQSP